MKLYHEFRDPIHQFILVKTDERRVVDSEPVQRLRHIHQLAMSYLVYPGATHRRFEHSLGVMELAGQVFDIVTRSDNVRPDVREHIPELNDTDNFPFWRSVVRMAALCHDLGHLPFSHASEHEVLPDGVSHESLSQEVIQSSIMEPVWKSVTPTLPPDVVAKLALGPEKHPGPFTDWEAVLAEIIVGDAFGVDRMDYLLRDSHHAGVAYGKFDHYRLIGSLRILKPPPAGDEGESSAPVIGIDVGGLHSAEALALARYFMFSQVYFHPVRVMYDTHLIEFLKEWLPGGMYPRGVAKHLSYTDNDVLIAIRNAAKSTAKPGHESAMRIQNRGHFKVLYERDQSDLGLSLEPSAAIVAWAEGIWGTELVRAKRSSKAGGSLEFPVLNTDDRVASSLSISRPLRDLPDSSYDRVYIAPEVRDEAVRRLKRDRDKILSDWSTSEEGS